MYIHMHTKLLIYTSIMRDVDWREEWTYDFYKCYEYVNSWLS